MTPKTTSLAFSGEQNQIYKHKTHNIRVEKERWEKMGWRGGQEYRDLLRQVKTLNLTSRQW